MTISATCYALFFFFPVLLLAYREIIVEGSNRIDERAHCWRGSKMWDATPKRHGCKDEHLEYLESKVRVARVTWTNEPTNDGRVLIRCGFMSQREVSSGWRRENARWCKYRGSGAMRSVIALSLDLTARPRMTSCVLAHVRTDNLLSPCPGNPMRISCEMRVSIQRDDLHRGHSSC